MTLRQTEGTSGYSHPNSPVRHSYPLAIQQGDFSTAWSLLMRTLPYMGARFAALLATSFATGLFWVVGFGGAAFLAARVHGFAGLLWFIACAISFRWAWRTAIRYFLFLLKAGHIAVLTELVTHGEVNHGNEHMFEYGKRVVTERFGEIHGLLALEWVIASIVSAFHRTLDWIAGLLPIPGARDIVGLVNTVVRAATSYVDETLLSYSLARGDSDHFRSARDGLIYYAQNSRDVLKTSIWIVVMDKLSTFIMWFAMVIPALGIGSLFPASIRGFAILFCAGMAFMLAWSIRSAVLEPLCLILVMIKFHTCVAQQPINLEWDDKLSQISDQFVALKNKVTQPGAPAPRPGLVVP